MPADEAAARRVRKLLSSRTDVTERRMFGGLAFMIAGNMLCAVGADHLMVRVGRDRYAAALDQPHAKEMRFTGRSMKGYVTVDPAGYVADEDLQRWVETALSFVTTLPSK